MKGSIIGFLLLVLTGFHCSGQKLVFTGRIRCLNNGVSNSTRGAGNLIIAPGILPSKATLTDPPPNGGFYTIHTGLSFLEMKDKKFRFYVINGCKSCSPIIFHQFVSEDQLDESKSDASNYYIRIRDYKVNQACDSLEKNYKADSLLALIRSKDDEDEGEDGILAAPGLLQVLWVFGALAPPKDSIVTSIVPIQYITPSTIQGGRLMFNSLLLISGNMGFNLAPNRNRSEVVFWNPAAMAMQKNRFDLSCFTNYRNNIRLAATLKINERFAAGIGMIAAGQNEMRSVLHDTVDFEEKTRLVEGAYFAGISWRVSKKVALGLNGKILNQKYKLPAAILETRHYRDGSLRNISYDLINGSRKCTQYDMDITSLISVRKNLLVGISLMNVFNSRLISHLNTTIEDPSWVSQSMYSVGFNYFWKRFNIGSDFVLWNNRYFMSSGLSFVPINDGEISIGWSSQSNEYSVGLRYKRCKLTYVEYKDNQMNFRGRFIFSKPKIFASLILNL